MEIFEEIGVEMVEIYIGLNMIGKMKLGEWGKKMKIGEGMFIIIIENEFFEKMRDI